MLYTTFYLLFVQINILKCILGVSDAERNEPRAVRAESRSLQRLPEFFKRGWRASESNEYTGGTGNRKVSARGSLSSTLPMIHRAPCFRSLSLSKPQRRGKEKSPMYCLLLCCLVSQASDGPPLDFRGRDVQSLVCDVLVDMHVNHKIPLISRVRGPYGKLGTEFFPSFYGPSAKRAGHENKEGKNENP